SHSLSFFFQAEDGIRDLIVTGVQTCALPIFRLAALDLGLGGEDDAVAQGGQGDLLHVVGDGERPALQRRGGAGAAEDGDAGAGRSEERRVGKGGRGGGGRWRVRKSGGEQCAL